MRERCRHRKNALARRGDHPGAQVRRLWTGSFAHRSGARGAAGHPHIRARACVRGFGAARARHRKGRAHSRKPSAARRSRRRERASHAHRRTARSASRACCGSGSGADGSENTNQDRHRSPPRRRDTGGRARGAFKRALRRRRTYKARGRLLPFCRHRKAGALPRAGGASAAQRRAGRARGLCSADAPHLRQRRERVLPRIPL